MAYEGESSVWSFGWPTKIVAFFQPDREAKTVKPAGVLLYKRLETFLWWFGGFKRPEMGDRMRERETPRFCYGVNTSMVHRCSWRLWTVGSRMNWTSAVIGLICKLIGRSGWSKFWSGVARCTESLVHRVTWHNRIEGQIVLRAEMDLGFNLVW
jgi:hypothetical protein